MKLLPYPYQSHGWGDAPDTRWFLARIKEWIHPGIRFADVGAATGILGLRVRELGASVTFYESDPRMQDLIARNLAVNKGPDATGIHGLFPDEWDGNRYDLLVANIGKHSIDLSKYADRYYDTEDFENA